MKPSPQIREDLPEAFDILDPVWIAMPDGVKLAARILLPRSAPSKPVPAILEYIPYRRRDGTLLGDTPRHAYFAGHGYAAVRVDLRGSGDSEGILLDEYLKQEHDDAIAVIAWLAAQPWCNGKVGMTGYSWG
ncbi:MAG: CocE/NonD family hydrolase, partial [Hypericibacter sp.]